MQILRDYWFSSLFALAGIAIGVMAVYSDEWHRKMWLSIVVLLLAAGTISFIWGDPVRGPFYGLTHPHSTSEFRLHAGGIHRYPIKQLADGIDFSHVINIPGQPLEFSFKKTWWFRPSYTLRIRTADGRIYTIVEKSEIGDLPLGADVNWDDKAIEFVDAAQQPLVQVIQAEDNDLYINSVITASPDGNILTILNGDNLYIRMSRSMVNPRMLPKRLFKYPSYANRGTRE